MSKTILEIEELISTTLNGALDNAIKVIIPDKIDSDSLHNHAGKGNKGVVFIYYLGDDFKQAGASNVFKQEMKFAITVLSKQNRSSGGVYDIIDTITIALRKLRDGGKFIPLKTTNIPLPAKSNYYAMQRNFKFSQI